MAREHYRPRVVSADMPPMSWPERESGTVSIWSSMPADLGAWDVDYADPNGPPTYTVDVATNHSWNRCVRLAVWSNTGGDQIQVMLTVVEARQLAKALGRAVKKVSRDWMPAEKMER
jgi:hypothetical protein